MPAQPSFLWTVYSLYTIFPLPLCLICHNMKMEFRTTSIAVAIMILEQKDIWPVRYINTHQHAREILSLILIENRKNDSSAAFQSHFKASTIIWPIWAGDLTTCIPHSPNIFILASAVSSFPPMMAPA